MKTKIGSSRTLISGSRWLHGQHRTAKVRSNALSTIRRCGADRGKSTAVIASKLLNQNISYNIKNE
ncbi:unnamed protein product, partial [Timema podura]|nr:unnamed protein product [Timema podura]